MWDVHMHCKFSGDSSAAPEAMAEAAIRAGLEGICFTDHHDIDYPKLPDEDDFLIPFDAYFKEMNGLRERFLGKLSIRTGIELGLQPHVAEENAEVASSHPFDFIIGSVHVVDGQDPYYPSFYEGRDEKASLRAYFEDTIRNLNAFSDFDVLGHIGYIVRYAPNKDENYHPADYADYIDEILKFVIERGKGIECNTSGYKGGLHNTIPCREILVRYKELGGEILTIGSDAHEPLHVAYAFDRACDLLKEIGFRYLASFRERKPEFYKI